MKRSKKEDAVKDVKKQKLLEELGDRKLQYLTPKDAEFQLLWEAKYSKLAFKEASKIPQDLHEKVQSAFRTLLEQGCFFHDLVQLKGKNLFTPVSRILIGDKGCTYRYLNTRLFTVPWSTFDNDVKYSNEEITSACQAFAELNKYFKVENANALRERGLAAADVEHVSESLVKPCSGDKMQKLSWLPANELSMSDSKGEQQQEIKRETDMQIRTLHNVTLLNYMDPIKMINLKEEPYFGMGKMAVSWHHDENLVERSSVAVYNYSCTGLETDGDENVEDLKGRNPALWHVGLKIAWDIQTPGLAVPLLPGDCYFILDDMNMTHQHCVLAGHCPRFSSTHRVAECSTGTLEYILGCCQKALCNLYREPGTGKTFLLSLETAILKQMEGTHTEVEFEWLRQFWFQGKRYRKCTDWWFEPMAKLEKYWELMECMTNLALCEIKNEELPTERKQEVINCLLPFLTQRQELRKVWMARTQNAVEAWHRRFKCKPESGDVYTVLTAIVEEQKLSG
ncbi:alpha-ketoglutarate-dependent dioxygenase FTO [Protopterus annectens]|uniref:alpha-ketoglutarate-dependent dioxygenase FTO n=1 Tax=Protopterus annectens TaxID=7888 RepID=UPI001CF99CC3|nr:alpha-ketoglutarate-dependent dioxygenase FTO [Protopterus annectens]